MSCHQTSRAQDDPYAFTESAPLQANSLLYANHSSTVGSNVGTTAASTGISVVTTAAAKSGVSLLASSAVGGNFATANSQAARAPTSVTVGTIISSKPVVTGSPAHPQISPSALKVRYNGVVTPLQIQKAPLAVATTPVFTKPLQIRQQTPQPQPTVTVGKLIKKVLPQKSPLLTTVVAGDLKGFSQLQQRPLNQTSPQQTSIISPGGSILTTVTTPNGTALKFIKIPQNQLGKATITGIPPGNFIQVSTGNGTKKLLTTSNIGTIGTKSAISVTATATTPPTIIKRNAATVVSTQLPSVSPTKIRLIQPNSQGKIYLQAANGNNLASTTHISSPISIAALRNSLVRQQQLQQLNNAKIQQPSQPQQPQSIQQQPHVQQQVLKQIKQTSPLPIPPQLKLQQVATQSLIQLPQQTQKFVQNSQQPQPSPVLQLPQQTPKLVKPVPVLQFQQKVQTSLAPPHTPQQQQSLLSKSDNNINASQNVLVQRKVQSQSQQHSSILQQLPKVLQQAQVAQSTAPQSLLQPQPFLQTTIQQQSAPSPSQQQSLQLQQIKQQLPQQLLQQQPQQQLQPKQQQPKQQPKPQPKQLPKQQLKQQSPQQPQQQQQHKLRPNLFNKTNVEPAIAPKVLSTDTKAMEENSQPAMPIAKVAPLNVNVKSRSNGARKAGSANKNAPAGKQQKGKRTYSQRSTEKHHSGEQLTAKSGPATPASAANSSAMLDVEKVPEEKFSPLPPTSESVSKVVSSTNGAEESPAPKQPKLKLGPSSRATGAIAVPMVQKTVREWHAPGAYMFDLNDPDDESDDDEDACDLLPNTLSFWYEESIAVSVPERSSAWAFNPPHSRAGPSHGGSVRMGKDKPDDSKFEIRMLTRDERLELKKAYLQRRAVQCRNGLRMRNVSAAKRRLESMTKMMEKLEARRLKALNEESEKPKCLSRGCNEAALVMTTHCYNHITENTEQRLFQRCTAKFSDNRQCRVPVFDISHELVLCKEHAWKHDNHDKMTQEVKQKKPARKKPKPIDPPVARTQKRPKKKKKLIPLQQQMILDQHQFKQLLGNTTPQHHLVQSGQMNQLPVSPEQQQSRKVVQQQSLLIGAPRSNVPGVTLGHIDRLPVQPQQHTEPQAIPASPYQHQQYVGNDTAMSSSGTMPVTNGHILNPLSGGSHLIGESTLVDAVFPSEQSDSTVPLVGQLHQHRPIHVQHQRQVQQPQQQHHDLGQLQHHQVNEEQLLLDYIQQQQHQQLHHHQPQLQQHYGTVATAHPVQPMLNAPVTQDLLTICENSSAYASSEDTGVGGLSESELMATPDVIEEIIPFDITSQLYSNVLSQLPADELNELLFSGGGTQDVHDQGTGFDKNTCEVEEEIALALEEAKSLDDMTVESGNFLGDFLENVDDEILDGSDICSDQILHSPNNGSDIRGLVHT
ncbi:uncharacterized protein LOC128270275 [Anopheles cruzii]|uniref:uncharacterized protein LOC128270275 n=1 Tax=Anopheles cruzii TaxID=68878 RepID=UPI0022EC83CD|nr:uncharacterized protein LOC128270275 [Anopheles cruzii]